MKQAMGIKKNKPPVIKLQLLAVQRIQPIMLCQLFMVTEGNETYGDHFVMYINI